MIPSQDKKNSIKKSNGRINKPIAKKIETALPIKKNNTLIRVRPIRFSEGGDMIGILLWNTFFQKEILNNLKGENGATNYTLFNDEYEILKSNWEFIFSDPISEKAEGLNMTVESIKDIDYIFQPEFVKDVIFLYFYYII